MNTINNFVANKKVTRFSNEESDLRYTNNKQSKKARNMARKNKRMQYDII